LVTPREGTEVLRGLCLVTPYEGTEVLCIIVGHGC
jgi:hypothetical protein